MPEKVLKKLSVSVLPQWKVCFFASILAGLFAHLYKITNWLPNWDSLVFRYDGQNMIALGRWFLPVVCAPSSFYDLPFLSGLLAIVFHALGAVCICKILNVQKKVTAALIGAVLVSFPTVTSVMMYNYVADGYSIAFFLAALAALYLTSEKPKFLLASVLIALSVGIYQAYITVTVMLVLLKLLDEMIYHKKTLGTVLKQAGKILLFGILGVVIYGVVLKLLLGVYSVELLDYQGVNTAASLSGLNLRDSLYVIRQTFLGCFFDVFRGVRVSVVINAVIFLVTLVSSVIHIIRARLYRKPMTLLSMFILGILLVLGAGALAFVNAGVDYHNLMLMGYAVFYLFFLILYERKPTTVKCWIVLTVAVVLIANQVVIANVSYHKAQIAYEKSYGVLLRIADRIEQTPGAEDCARILVVGALDNSEAYSVNLAPDITGITDGYIIRADDETVGQSVLCSALSDYCEMDYEFVSGAEKQQLMQREPVSSMGKWPAKDCVAVVDDTVVIKLGTEGENE